PEIHTDGSFTLTMDNSQFQYLAVDETEDLSFTYQVEDADGDTETATITVTVTGVNDAPIARELSSETLEEDSVRVQAVFADTDIDATDDVDVTAVTQDAQGGLFTFENDHIEFDPQDDFIYLAFGESTTVTTTYTITDEHGASDTHSWSVEVIGQNGAPVAVNDSTTITEDEDISGFNLLSNDWDPDASDVISLVSLAQPSKGESVLESSSEGTVGFNTGSDFDYLNVGDSITLTMDYDIEDDTEAAVTGTDTGQFSITITGVNDGPVANMDIASVSESGSVNITVLDNDTDVDQNATLSLVSAKVVYGGGSVSLDGNEVVFNTNGDFENLALGQTGEAVIEYVMEDEHGAQSTSAAFVQ
ncbi:MAG: Ig-like domain-containing protein, partial [Pseudomonadota bacterium]|nr:Ig-like domain-containing protein [Pseudomonadota bacterium]